MKFLNDSKRLKSPLPFQDLNLGGIGIGNGWINPKYQCNHAQTLKSLGLINHYTFEALLKLEKETLLNVESGEMLQALNHWQNEMHMIDEVLKMENMYDLSNVNLDASEQNFWHFLQNPLVRRAIHVGNITLDGGKDVSTVTEFNSYPCEI